MITNDFDCFQNIYCKIKLGYNSKSLSCAEGNRWYINWYDLLIYFRHVIRHVMNSQLEGLFESLNWKYENGVDPMKWGPIITKRYKLEDVCNQQTWELETRCALGSNFTIAQIYKTSQTNLNIPNEEQINMQVNKFSNPALTLWKGSLDLFQTWNLKRWNPLKSHWTIEYHWLMHSINIIFGWPFERCNSINHALVKKFDYPESLTVTMTQNTANIESCHEVHCIVCFHLYVGDIMLAGWCRCFQCKFIFTLDDLYDLMGCLQPREGTDNCLMKGTRCVRSNEEMMCSELWYGADLFFSPEFVQFLPNDFYIGWWNMQYIYAWASLLGHTDKLDSIMDNSLPLKNPPPHCPLYRSPYTINWAFPMRSPKERPVHVGQVGVHILWP